MGSESETSIFLKMREYRRDLGICADVCLTDRHKTILTHCTCDDVMRRVRQHCSERRSVAFSLFLLVGNLVKFVLNLSFKIINKLKFNNIYLKFNNNFKKHYTFKSTIIILVLLLL